MKKQFFKDAYGNSASITDTGIDFRLICRNYNGKIWKRSSHVSARAAKLALERTGGIWHTTKGVC